MSLPGSVLVRPLGEEDAPRYREMMLAAYAAEPTAFTASLAERSAATMDWWRARASGRAGETMFGAFVDGRLVGVAGLKPQTRERTRHKASLVGLCVESAYRRQGLGRLLVEAVLAAARAAPGLRLVQLTVTGGNDAALKLYEQAGFLTFGEEPMAVALGDGFVSKIHLWRLL